MAVKQVSDPEYFLRISWRRRLEHHAGAILFIVLVATGLAQRFHSAAWADWLILALGGIDATRVVHRVAGLLFALLNVQHILVALHGTVFRGWRPSMVINGKDFQDLIDNLRYYFGLSDRPARCDRYDYRQKFEYWGVVLGGVLMVVTGFMLWFPIRLFQLLPFLPGQSIPAAKIAHSNEAMLALLVIVIWHIYNAVLSPEVFPLDTAIFTGRISRERMLHEHPLEYERLTGKSADEALGFADPKDAGDSPEAGDPKEPADPKNPVERAGELQQSVQG